MEEEFEKFPSPEFEDKYNVSNRGKIWSVKKKKYIRTHLSNGEVIIFLYRNKRGGQFKIAEIVLDTFQPDIQKENTIINHIDGDIHNNDITNLERVPILDYLQKKYTGIWKPVVDVDNYYVSSKGLVWSLYNKELITQRDHAGYPSVSIGYPKQKFVHVHRLVATAFLPNRNNLPMVVHKNKNPSDNRLENLEWSSSNKDSATKHYANIDEYPVDGKSPTHLSGYIICKDGRIYSKKCKRYMIPQLNASGYHRIQINVNRTRRYFFVHRLVAETWLDDPGQTESLQVNHKDLNKSNNHVDNLEWITCQDNIQHSIDSNRKRYNHLQKKVVQIDIKTGKEIKTYDGIKEASRDTGANSGSIVKVCKGIRKTAGGFNWKYITDLIK